MTFKSGRILYFILIICTFLWNQQPPLLTQKIAVENSYRDKVVAAVSRLLGQENFIVIVNIEFATVGGTRQTTASSTSSKQGSLNSYSPIPGLPTVPSRNSSLSNTRLDNSPLGKNNYPINRVVVDINLNKELATAEIKQKIRSLIKKVLPEIRECDDCIKIEELEFFPLAKSNEIQELKDEIADLRAKQNKAEENDLKKTLKETEDRLKVLQDEKVKSDDIIQSRDDELQKRDAAAHDRLVEFEITRNKLDSIRNDNIEKELRQVRKNRTNSDSTLLSKTMAIVEKKEGLFGGHGIMGAVIFILLIICLLIVTFMAAKNNKSSPIYLKPKSKKTGKEAKDNSTERNNGKEENTSSVASTSSPPIRDEEAVLSELRSLRQTAVSLSVGEKENASALIKEWLEDNPNKEGNPEGEQGE